MVLVLLYDNNEQKRTCNITFISPVFNIKKKVSQINHVNPIWVLSSNCSDKNNFILLLLAAVGAFGCGYLRKPCLRGNIKTSQLPGANPAICMDLLDCVLEGSIHCK